MTFVPGHTPHNKGQKKAGAPAVALDRSGHRIRLRNIDHALEGCLSSEGKEIRYRLEPNRWTEVPDEVYAELKAKFNKPQTMDVPDWEPGGEGQRSSRERRTEEIEEYVMEFSDER